MPSRIAAILAAIPLVAGMLLGLSLLLAPTAQAPSPVDCPSTTFAVVHPIPASVLTELEQYITWRQIRLLRPLEYVETRQRGNVLVYSVRAIGTTPQGWQTTTIDIGFDLDGSIRCCVEK